jgi:hypothetical protein
MHNLNLNLNINNPSFQERPKHKLRSEITCSYPGYVPGVMAPSLFRFHPSGRGERAERL